MKQDLLENKNSFLAKVSWLSASSLFRNIIQFITIIFLANRLTVSENGTYLRLWIIVNTFSAIGLFGFPLLLLSNNLDFVYNWLNKKRKLIFITIVFVIVVLTIYLFYFENIFSISQKVFLIVFTLLYAVSILGESILIKQGKEKSIFYISIMYYLLYLTIHLLYGYFKIDFNKFLILLTIITFIRVITNWCYKNKTNKTDFINLEIGKQWIYLGANEVLNVIVKWLDKWVIIAFFPSISFAVYFNGTYEIPIFLLLMGAVGSVSTVEISKLKIEDKEKIISIFKTPIVLLATIVFPSFAFLLFNSSNVFQIFFNGKYNESIPIFLMTLLILPIRVLYSTSILQAFNKNDKVLKGVVIDLIFAIIFMLSLYPMLGLRGLALAFVFSTYIQVGYYLWHSAKLLHTTVSNLIPIKEIAVMFFISILVSFSIFEITKILSTYLSLTINTVICCALVSSFYFFTNKVKDKTNEK